MNSQRSGLEATLPTSTASRWPIGALASSPTWHLFRYRFSEINFWIVPVLLVWPVLGILSRIGISDSIQVVAGVGGATGAALVVAASGLRKQFWRGPYISALATLTKRELELERKVASQRTALEPQTAELLYLHIRDIVDTAAVMASAEVGATCAAAVKLLFLPTPGSHGSADPEVQTVVRDSKSAGTRARSPERFPYFKNTAFREIVHQNKPNAFYACADLLEAERRGDYDNISDSWRTQYNSTLVIAIADPEGGPSDRIYGFLCIDSWAGDVTRAPMRHLMSALTVQLYRAFEMLSAAQGATEDDGTVNGD